jgi:hypothetical protein
MSGNEQVSALPVRQRTVGGQAVSYPIENQRGNIGIALAWGRA